MLDTREDITTTTAYLLARISKAFRGLAQERLSALDLHIGQDIVLTRLWEEEGVTQSELAERLNVQPATMTTILQRMCKAGLIERRRDEEDQRVWRIYTTPQADALCDEISAVWEAYNQTILKDFSIEERVLLHRLLLQVNENITAEAG